MLFKREFWLIGDRLLLLLLALYVYTITGPVLLSFLTLFNRLLSLPNLAFESKKTHGKTARWLPSPFA